MCRGEEALRNPFHCRLQWDAHLREFTEAPPRYRGMRLWSLHPKTLDSRGLTALWREALLARAVLRGRTKGYRRHPQLVRFRNHPRPITLINVYLREIWREADRRGYRFDHRKLERAGEVDPLPVTRGQLVYERGHLLDKLRRRDPERWRNWASRIRWPRHPLFAERHGPVEAWEKVS